MEIASTAVESLLSLLLGPLLFYLHARFVLEILTGGQVTWRSQSRDPWRSISWKEACRAFWLPTILGGLGVMAAGIVRIPSEPVPPAHSDRLALFDTAGGVVFQPFDRRTFGPSRFIPRLNGGLGSRPVGTPAPLIPARVAALGSSSTRAWSGTMGRRHPTE